MPLRTPGGAVSSSHHTHHARDDAMRGHRIDRRMTLLGGAEKERRDGLPFPPSSFSASFPALADTTRTRSPPPRLDLVSSPPHSSPPLPPPLSSSVSQPPHPRRRYGRRQRGDAARAEEQGRGGDRFLALWREYHDVLQETEAKKRRLESKNRRKLRLLAEVKFLRRKYEFLVKCNSQQPKYKLKGQARQIQSPMGINEASASADNGAGTGMPSTSKNTNLGLNQESVMNDNGFDQGHKKFGDFDQDGVAEDITATGVKFSVCRRDTESSPSSDDKRTTSWQDRLSLQA